MVEKVGPPLSYCFACWLEQERNVLIDIAVLGIDLGKTIYSLAGQDRAGGLGFLRVIAEHRNSVHVAQPMQMKPVTC